MRKLLAVLSLALMTMGCNDNGAMNNLSCYKEVRKEFTKAKIYTMSHEEFKFVVVDTCGTVIFVETKDTDSPKITDVTILEEVK